MSWDQNKLSPYYNTYQGKVLKFSKQNFFINDTRFKVMIADACIRSLAIPNQIVDNSKSDSKDFERQNPSDLKSDNKFGFNWSIFD